MMEEALSVFIVRMQKWCKLATVERRVADCKLTLAAVLKVKKFYRAAVEIALIFGAIGKMGCRALSASAHARSFGVYFNNSGTLYTF